MSLFAFQYKVSSTEVYVWGYSLRFFPRYFRYWIDNFQLQPRNRYLSGLPTLEENRISLYSYSLETLSPAILKVSYSGQSSHKQASLEANN